MTKFFDTNLLTQIFGIIGLILAVIWPIFQKRQTILLIQSGIGVAFLIHFWLLGAATGALMNLLSGVQALAAIPLGDRPYFRWIYLLTLPAIGAALVSSWQGPSSLCAAIAMAIVSVGRYQLSAPRLRAVILLSAPLWVGHSMLVGSVPALAADVIGACVLMWQVLADRRDAKRARLLQTTPMIKEAAESPAAR